MNRGWLGLGRVVLILGAGIAVAIRNRKARHARGDVSTVKDELLLLGSGLLLALILMGGIFWVELREDPVERIAVVFVFLIVCSGPHLRLESHPSAQEGCETKEDKLVNGSMSQNPIVSSADGPYVAGTGFSFNRR